MISLIVFTDKYQGHAWTLYTNGFSLHSNYILLGFILTNIFEIIPSLLSILLKLASNKCSYYTIGQLSDS